MSKLSKAARERLEALKNPVQHHDTKASSDGLKGSRLPGERQAKSIPNHHQHRGSSGK